MELGDSASGIGALADPTRRALYEYVVAQPEPVGREQAASALELALHTAAFHLDRLVSEGLLDVDYRRLSGRSGPGAGRPSKLYRRADREFAVSLPPRRYDLVGDILAGAVARVADGAPLPRALAESAHVEGRAVGREGEAGDGDPLAAIARLLEGEGYQPHVEGAAIALSNCPFDALARKHRELVCGLNRDFVEGLAEGAGCGELTVALSPQEGRCCVTVSA